MAPPTVAVNQPAKVPPMMIPNRQRIGIRRRRLAILSFTGVFSPDAGGIVPGLNRPMRRTVTHSRIAVTRPGITPPIRAVPTLMVMGEIRQYIMIAMEGGISVDRAPEAAMQPME